MADKSSLLRRVRASKAKDDSDVDLDSQDEQDVLESYELPQSLSRGNGLHSKNESEDSRSQYESDEEGASLIAGSEDVKSESEPEPDSKAILSSISFGDLATAQSSLGPRRKRKRGALQEDSDAERSKSRSPSPFHEAEERLAGKSKRNPLPGSRTSKHAPTELSSKKAVSRRRTVISVPKFEARDPRFSNLSGNLNANKVSQNYAFLNDYRADELRQLKEQIRGTKDAATKERLKRQMRALEDRERARKKVEDEQAVVREHRRTESEAVKQGKKPFYMKKAEIKKQVLVKRFENLGEKKADKVMERRRKKKAMKERKSMPRERREVE